jgi:hypothetical protein
MRMRAEWTQRTRGGKAVVGALVAMTALGAASAMAATQLGNTSPAASACTSSPISFFTSANPPGSEFAVPNAGVITAWQFNATASPPQLKLKIFRDAGSNNVLVVGQSSAETPTPSTLNTFSTRIPVQAGDRLGLTILTDGPCGTTGSGNSRQVPGDPADGATVAAAAPFSGFINIGASLEADADADGFGDETQDQCPASAATQGECDPPETTITKGPKAKSDNATVTLKFESDEEGSSFHCKLKGKGKKGKKKKGPCKSPKRYRDLPPNRYNFKVTATDAAGNEDPTPAKRRFTIEE